MDSTTPVDNVHIDNELEEDGEDDYLYYGEEEGECNDETDQTTLPNYQDEYFGEHEIPGEGDFYRLGELRGDREGTEYEEEEEAEDEIIDEDEMGSFLELIQVSEEIVDGPTTLEALAELQQTMIETPYPKMSVLRDLLNMIAIGLAHGGPPLRQEAVDAGAYQIIMKAWALWCNSGIPRVKLLSERCNVIRYFSMRALVSLTPGFPDELDDLGTEMVLQGLSSNVPMKMHLETLRLLRNLCIKSEKNRERFCDSPGFFDSLCHLIKRSEGAEFEQVVREWCGTVKTLMLNDDPRVPYNQAPERKRAIYQQKILPIVGSYLSKEDWGVPTLNAIMVVLGTFAINEDYCLHIDLGGVLTSIQRILTNPHLISNPMLIKNTLSCLRYMVSGEEIRARAATMGLVRFILKIMQLYRKHPDVLEVGASCCAFLTMNNACQSALFFAVGGLTMFIDLMQRNPEHIYLLKGCILTLRNYVVNGLDKGKKSVLNAGGEALLREIAERFPELKLNYVKPALNDLGLDISITPISSDPKIEILKAPEKSEEDEEEDEEEQV